MTKKSRINKLIRKKTKIDQFNKGLNFFVYESQTFNLQQKT